MFCLRSWLPLLFIPTNASPAFILLFFVCTYFLNRPCVYCSFLLLILFMSSCYWSDRCFFDFGSSNLFEPRSPIYIPADDISSSSSSSSASNGCDGTSAGAGAGLDIGTIDELNATALEIVNSTACALASAAAEEVARKRAEWTGIGLEWLRSLLGKREWRIECMDLSIRL